MDIQAESHPHRGTRKGRGVMETLPWVFAVFRYFGKIWPLIEGLRCALHDGVYVVGCGAAGSAMKLQHYGHAKFTKTGLSTQLRQSTLLFTLKDCINLSQ